MGTIYTCAASREEAISDINATIDQCWAVITDIEKYPEWNTLDLACVIQNTGTPLKLGTKVRQIIADGPGRTKEVDCWVSEFQKPSAFELAGDEGCTTCGYGRHYFHFQKLSDTQTRIFHGEVLGGVALWCMAYVCCGPCSIGPFLTDRLKPQYAEFNIAFKKRVEGLFPPRKSVDTDHFIG